MVAGSSAVPTEPVDGFGLVLLAEGRSNEKKKKKVCVAFKQGEEDRS